MVVKCNIVLLHVLHSANYRSRMVSSELVSANPFVLQDHDANNFANVILKLLFTWMEGILMLKQLDGFD